MKKTIVFLALIAMVSCTSKPDNVIHDQKTEAGNWVLLPGAHDPIQEKLTYYQIEPTWSQSLAWANQRDDRALTVSLGLLLFIAFVGLLVGNYTYAKWFPEIFEKKPMLYNALLFLTLAGSAYFYFGDASGIKWNNEKWVRKEAYDKAIKENGSTAPIWDSLRNNCLIVDGPYDCYKK